MGVYDTVEVPCPKCGKIAYFQSKSGERLMENYTLDTVPEDVFLDINRHAPYKCRDCKTLFFVGTEKEPLIWESTFNPHDLYGEENE